MLTVASLCSGYGGIELGLKMAGIEHELLWYAETDKYAAKVMAHHHPGVPNLGDVTQIEDAPQVDIVCAGFPCQPVSVAGAGKGTKDERWIIRDVVRLAANAQWLILENVRGLFSANKGEAFGQVVDALAEGGFNAEWAPLRASDVGAPHRRERWFCVATAPDSDSLRLQRTGEAWSWRPEFENASHLLPTPTATDGRASGSTYKRTATHVPGVTLTDATTRAVVDWKEYEPAVSHWEEITRPAPSPLRNDKLSTSFVEWMMGLPEGYIVDRGFSKTQTLKMLGNGCVPQQAAQAIGYLM